ncbi:MAG: hypothetical protein ACTIA4_12785 [Brevibacterium aurantiacum]
MSSVDEILVSGEYESRTHGLVQRCRENCSGNGLWVCAGHFEPWEHLRTDQVALLIERDQHRDECLGLWECTDHPVPRVAVIESDYGTFARNSRVYDQHSTHSEAMDAARVLAVGA